MAVPPKSNARLVAATLAGAWRQTPPAFAGSADDLEEVAPLLLGSGAGALGWWKIRHTGLRDAPAAQELRQAYRLHTLQSALHERRIEQVFRLLGESGVEAVLVKGLAASRLYPEAGLRPFGDIDVCVRRGQFAEAEAALGHPRGQDFPVDLHRGFEDAAGRGEDELLGRAELMRVGAEDVPVLCAEDHLRLLCVHLLRHGAWRPLWLCDVAAAVENRPEGFDWSRLLRGDGRRARWVACAVGLAHQLLGARVEDTPFERAARRLPRWLAPEVLKSWEAPYTHLQAPMRHGAPMAHYLRRPRGVLKDLATRWPNPIEATIRLGGPLNELPRLPFQVGNVLVRAARFVSGLTETASGERRS